MKLIVKVFLLVTLLLPTSCKNNKEVNTKLLKAELLMEQKPDSALAVLQSIKNTSSLNERTFAFYGLLLTQALDKNVQTPKSDSTIRRSVKFYENSKDDRHKALAYFYLSRVIMNEDKKEAISYLLKAEEVALNLQDYNLLGLIYYDLGNVNDMQFVRLSASQYFRKAADCFGKANKKINQFHSLNSLGWFFIQNKQYDWAFKEFNKAEKIAIEMDNDQLLFIIYNSIAYTYLSSGQYQKAKQSISKSINLSSEFKDTPEIFVTLSLIYTSENLYDSAIINYKKAYELYKQNKDTTKTSGIALLLSNAYKQKGDFRTALEYREIHEVLGNQIAESINKSSIIEIEKNYKNQKIKAINQELKVANRNLWLLFTSSLLFAMFCLFLYFVVISNKNEKLMLAEIEKQQAELKMQHLEAKAAEARQILLSKLEIIKSINDINNLWEGDKHKFDEKVKKLLAKYALSEESWAEINDIINQMNDGLFDRLKNYHQNLSNDDIKLSCMIIAGLEVGEISPILGINNDSVFKKRKRLKKKLELNPEDDLKKYLISIS